mmetsp:Transcript_24257/g.71713  ORF Transcript_24257/g.71713 Transcript_24257/m.71713 type:complete len:272 (-) Transcript_24257:198-1013(-)
MPFRFLSYIDTIQSSATCWYSRSVPRIRNGTCTLTLAVASVSPVGRSSAASAIVDSIRSRLDLPACDAAAASASRSMSSAGSSGSSPPSASAPPPPPDAAAPPPSEPPAAAPAAASSEAAASSSAAAASPGPAASALLAGASAASDDVPGASAISTSSGAGAATAAAAAPSPPSSSAGGAASSAASAAASASSASPPCLWPGRGRRSPVFGSSTVGSPTVRGSFHTRAWTAKPTAQPPKQVQCPMTFMPSSRLYGPVPIASLSMSDSRNAS